MEKFVGCWDGVDDPRTGNASRHDFHESMGRIETDHGRWTNAFFVDQGLFTLVAAHEYAKYSR